MYPTVLAQEGLDGRTEAEASDMRFVKAGIMVVVVAVASSWYLATSILPAFSPIYAPPVCSRILSSVKHEPPDSVLS